jgi:chromosome segregation ATPase
MVVAIAMVFVRLENLRRDLTQTRGAMMTEVAKVRQEHGLSTEASRQYLDELRGDLQTARKQAASAAGQAKTDALKHADQLARQLQEEQAKQQAQISTELGDVRSAADTTNTKIADVSSDVGNVKTDVASTKSELDKTIAELKSVKGDLGVQSGLIATNSTELSALRALGDRNYFEFNVSKTKQFQKVGNVQIQLKAVDARRNKYTIQLVADDKTVEKKDKNLNEPLQFYVAGNRQPYEIVVNQVGKDKIVGYLSTPKVVQARN